MKIKTPRTDQVMAMKAMGRRNEPREKGPGWKRVGFGKTSRSAIGTEYTRLRWIFEHRPVGQLVFHCRSQNERTSHVTHTDCKAQEERENGEPT